MRRFVDEPEVTATQMSDDRAMEPADREVPVEEFETGVLGNAANCAWPE